MKITNMAVALFCTCFIVLAYVNGLVDATRVFKVGDEFGWQEPGANNTAVYGQWATRNRFRVGDSLSFEYKNDSVMEVDKWGFYHCNSSRPVVAFNNGKSMFKLNRPGPFYFISGTPNHCKNGQRLIIEVMGLHHHRYSPPLIAAPPETFLAPSPQPSSGEVVSITVFSVSVIAIATFVSFLWSEP